MRMIDADELYTQFTDDNYMTAKATVRGAIKNAPTIDPVKHGKNISENGFLCSVCSFGDFGGFHGYEPNYCPNCGCAMTKEKEK